MPGSGPAGTPEAAQQAICALFGVRHYDDVFERLVRMKAARPWAPVLSRRIAKSVLDRRLLFIHVPKNGGTSISTALYGGSPGHKTAWFYRCAAPEFYKAASPMAVLRDPVERFLSAYWFIRRGGGDKVVVKPAFARLMRSIATVDHMLDFVEGGLGRLYDLDHVLRPQAWYVTDPSGALIVHRLYLLERDLPELASVLAERGVSDIPALNQTRKGAADLTSGQIDRIRKLYARDVELVEALRREGPAR